MNLKHHFLLAMPGLTGDYFADSLTYVCEHNDDGAMGIMINRPSDISLTELLAQIGLKTNRKWVETPVLEGGPVSSERGFVLHSDDRSYDSSAHIGNQLCLSTALEVLDAIAQDDGPEHFMVALGYAGWDAGQLEQEISDNVWLTVPAEQQIMFQLPFAERLTQAAGCLGIDLRLISAKAGHA